MRKLVMLGSWMLSLALIAGCGGGGGSDVTGPGMDSASQILLALGDSMTHGRPRSVNDAGPDEPGFLRKLGELLLDIGRAMKIVESGEPGTTSDAGVSRIGGLLAEYHPGWVTIFYGTNDAFHGVDPARTLANLEAMVSASRKSGAQVVLCTLSPVCRATRAAQQERIDSLNPQIRSLASRLGGGVHLADIALAFKQGGGEALIHPASGVHPTPRGYEIIAVTIFNAMRPAL